MARRRTPPAAADMPFPNAGFWRRGGLAALFKGGTEHAGFGMRTARGPDGRPHGVYQPGRPTPTAGDSLFTRGKAARDDRGNVWSMFDPTLLDELCREDAALAAALAAGDARRVAAALERVAVDQLMVAIYRHFDSIRPVLEAALLARAAHAGEGPDDE